MRSTIRKNNGETLSQLLETEQMKLENSVNAEIALVLKLANSPLITAFFANPDDAALNKYAHAEIESYRKALAGRSVFWVNDKDRMFHTDGAAPYFVDIKKPTNYWYPLTLNRTEDYNFNINYNPELKVTNLWINAPVFDKNKKALGILGAGIELSGFVNTVFNKDFGRAELFLFNAAGEITGAKSIALVHSKRNIDTELENTGVKVFERALSLKPGEILLIDIPRGKMGIKALPLLGWYSVAILHDSIADYATEMTLLFFCMMLVLAFVLILSNWFLKRLHRARTQSDYENRRKDLFLANMSREVRVPINSILGMSSIGKSSEESSRKNFCFEKIEDFSRHLSEVVAQMVDISKIESGKFSIAKSEFCFRKMLERLENMAQAQAHLKNQVFEMTVDSEVPEYLVTDEKCLMQILLSLISNATKFTERGGKITLNVSAVKEKDGFYQVSMEVTDTGIGISPEQQKKIFQVFEQAAGEYCSGAGLGLPISKHLAGMLDGSISVRSAAGTGSAFTLKFKASRGMGYEKVLSLEDSVTESDFDGYRILVVDDVALNHEIILSYFEKTGVSIDSAVSGSEALRFVEDHPGKYHLILMDVQMPEMNGPDVARELRARGEVMPIIAMTANVFKPDVERYLDAGMNGYLEKPLEMRKVLETVREVLEF
ncbi:MAG: response regulator [Fibrobacter sp.]|nr:response regulator [Fibrobacter sp.]